MPDGMLAGHPGSWREFGYGMRRAIAVHCSLAHSGAWRSVSAQLQDLLTVIAFDLPGHGRAGAWDGVSEIQGVSAEMGAALMLPGEKVDLIGHSFGATVALRMAVEHPDRVRSLTLFEPVLFAVAMRNDPAVGPRYTLEMEDFVAAWMDGDLSAAARAFTDIWGDGTPWVTLSQVQQELLERQIHLIPAANQALHDDIGGVLEAGRLEALSCPVLLMEGGACHWIIPKINDGLAARLGNVQRVSIDGAGHMAPMTHPRAVANAIRGFLEGPD